MDSDLLRRLGEAGALSSLGEGVSGVKVSLQYQPKLKVASRKERREELHDCFAHVAEQIAPTGAAVDLESISVLGQTVEAVLPVEEYEQIVAELEILEVRVDPVISRDVADEKEATAVSPSDAARASDRRSSKP